MKAFCFYYRDNLEEMEAVGAEIVYFSPLHEDKLPEGLDGLLIGGGYPENYAAELSENTAMRQAVALAAAQGMPILAECGGYLYLLEELEGLDGVFYPMTGIFEGKGCRKGKNSRFGYVALAAEQDTPYLLRGEEIKGHEFHYWDCRTADSSWQMRAVKPVGKRTWPCMRVCGQVMAGFPHLYYPSAPLLWSGFPGRAGDLALLFAERLLFRRAVTSNPIWQDIEGGQKKMTLEEAVRQTEEADKSAKALARARWDKVAKPLNSLGVLEEDIVRIAGAQGDPAVSLEEKWIAVMCSDNGIVEEGVTQTGQSVTGIVAENMAKGTSCVCRMAACAGANVFPVDVGIAGDIHVPGLLQRRRLRNRKFSKGSCHEPQPGIEALQTGIEVASMLKEKGCRLAGTGEMGIGNTTTASAVISVLLGKEPEEVTGRGAGLSLEGYRRKVRSSSRV